MNINGIVNEWHYEDGCKGCHALALRVIWAHADQAMDTVLRLEIAVCHVAFDIEGDGLDTRFVALLEVGDGDFVVMLLAVALI